MMLEPRENYTVWFIQDWDDPDLYHIRMNSEDIEILTLEEAEKKYPRDKYAVLLQEWDDLDGTQT